MGQLSVEKANTMTDNVGVVAFLAAAEPTPLSLSGPGRTRKRLMHLKRDFWPFAFHPPSLPLSPPLWSSALAPLSGGEITSILSSLWGLPPAPGLGQ